MSLEGLVISLTILVIVGLWVASPLVNRRLQQASANSEKQESQLRHDRLLAQYDRLLAALRDLEEDNATGKFQADEYATEREQLIQRGIQLLVAIDTSVVSVTPTEKSTEKSAESRASKPKDAVDREIEEAVASYRRKATSR